MNWHTDWERAEGIAALWEPLPLTERKTFAIRSAAAALLAWALMWGAFDAFVRML